MYTANFRYNRNIFQVLANHEGYDKVNMNKIFTKTISNSSAQNEFWKYICIGIGKMCGIHGTKAKGTSPVDIYPTEDSDIRHLPLLDTNRVYRLYGMYKVSQTHHKEHNIR